LKEPVAGPAGGGKEVDDPAGTLPPNDDPVAVNPTANFLSMTTAVLENGCCGGKFRRAALES